MKLTTQTIKWHGEPGWRFAFIRDLNFIDEFVIREVTEGFDIFQDYDGDEVRICCTDTLDEAILYINQIRTNPF